MHIDVVEYWGELAELARRMPLHLVDRAAEILFDCHAEDRTVFVAGNGGSAATASHFACDLAKGTRSEGVRRFRVMPLTDNIPLMTAWANDLSYEAVFAEQLRALVRPGDVLVVISASGSSPNIVSAARVARAEGAEVIAMTGRSGGRVRGIAGLTIPVPSDCMELVEDAHLALSHSLCVALRRRLQGCATAGMVGTSEEESVVLDMAL